MSDSIKKIVINRGPTGVQGDRGLQGPPGPGLEIDSDLIVQSLSDTVLKFRKVGSDGIARSAVITMVPEAGPEAPTLESLAEFLVNPENPLVYEDILWSPSTPDWVEPATGLVCKCWVDITLPPGVPSDYGWEDGFPLANHHHFAGGNHHVRGGSVNAQLKQKLLAKGIGFASWEIPHPVITPGTPLTFWGRSVQYARSLASALNLDPVLMFNVGRSRGNYSYLTALQPDLADPSSDTLAGTLSSVIQWHFGVNPQSVYRTGRAVDLFVIESDRNAYYALQGPDNPAMPCAVDMIATAPQIPHLACCYDKPFVDRTIYPDGKVPASVIGTNQHWPESGNAFKEAYAPIAPDKFVCWDDSEVGGDTEQLGYCADWIMAMWSGLTCAEAMFEAVAKAKGHAAHHIPVDENGVITGVWQLTDGTNASTPVVSVGQSVGAIADASKGKAARSQSTPLAATAAGQTTAGQRPTLGVLPNGRGLAIATNQRMLIAFAGSGEDRQCVYWGLTKEYTRAGVYAGGAIGIGFSNDSAANATGDVLAAMVSAAQGVAITEQDKKIYRHLARRRTLATTY